MNSYPAALRRAALIATLGLIVATSTVLAGTTVGSALQLGIANSLSSSGSTINSTRLTGAVNGDQLSLSNTSTSSVAKAVAALSRSATSATARFENTGGGPALSLVVPAGKAPLYVSRGAGKATNLNADRVDGIEGGALAKGTGVTVLANRLVLQPAATTLVPLLTLPGLGKLEAWCGTGSEFADIGWENTTNQWIQVWRDVDGERTADTFGAGDSMPVAVYRSGYGHYGRTLLIGSGTGTGPTKTATVELAAFRVSKDHPCSFQVTATIWSKP